MSFQLERFRITGLHGVRAINIPIKDNRLILVGENGTGKTTVANCIYFFITRQWNRMASYRFESIEMTLNSAEEPLYLSYKDIRSIKPTTSKYLGKYRESSIPMSMQRRIERTMSQLNPSDVLNDETLREQLSYQLRIPERMLLDHLILLDDNQGSNTERFDRVQDQLSEMIKEPVLYLPTFRRIEKDLQYIYPQLDLDEFTYRRRRRRFPDRTNRPYIELVEFGMEDVKETIEKTMDSLKETLRRSLNDLTGTYLREVIQGEYENVDHEPLLELTEREIDAILDKVGENLLPHEEKRTLRQIIESLRSEDDIESRNKVVIHFLVRLVELHKKQEENEQSVVKFVEVCNDYLRDKQLIFDSTQFEIHISHNQEGEEARQDIEMGMLSSGEKQIVSLFSHIYLSGQKDYFVVIDEPELSLSVPWQKKFLPDILATNKCAGLIAVTHSPFIFDNELDSFAHDIKEFWV